MGREVRRVPPGWQHPRDAAGRYVPLLRDYDLDLAQWTVERRNRPEMSIKEFETHWAPCPDPVDYMPRWRESEKTHLQMYETCTEGTPISPPMPDAESLARWLADNEASAFGDMTATYGQWLATIAKGGSVSAIVTGAGVVSGVAYNRCAFDRHS